MRVQPLFLAFAACATAVDGSSPPRDVLAATPTPGRASVDRGPDGRERADGAPAGVPDPFDALRIRYRPLAGDVAEGRGKKKKNKDKKNKMGLMMGAAAMGMTVIGGIATKMMMGGVTMIAIKALIIAKLALLLASVIALKKLIGGGGGGLAGGGVAAGPSWNGGVGGVADAGGGYRRSYGAQADDAATASAEHGLSAANALAYRDQIGNSYGR